LVTSHVESIRVFDAMLYDLGFFSQPDLKV
jgi:hypothetical protein